MSPVRAEARPNIVVIVADDMGFGDFGFVNGGISSTPALDDLAATSLVLEQHYSASPVCAPARAALLTGRYPQRTGVIDTLEARGTDRLRLDEVTIADVLRHHGYRTGIVGKWHTGAVGEAYAPTRRGFDEFAGFRGGWQDYWDWHLEHDGTPMEADGRYLTDVLTEEAAGFIRRHAGRPFFLHVAFNAPHFPFQAPADLVEKHRAAGRTEVVATIYAMLEAMDRGVGQIVRALADAGLTERTIVVFTSDNGPDHAGEGDRCAARFNAGLAGSKQHVYDGGIRVPAIVHWPGTVAPGRSDAFVHLTDWFPTLLRIAGAGSGGASGSSSLPLDGRDVSPLLLGQAVEDTPRFWQWTRYRPRPDSNAAMRDGRWKLVRPAVPATLDLRDRDQAIDVDIKRRRGSYVDVDDTDPPPPEAIDAPPARLFDLAADPGEQRDVATDHPGVVARMQAELDRWFDEMERDRLTPEDRTGGRL
ncbi:sulfatase-like hydrolase/transferase [Jiangella asiatica]|uniref:Arylsulfatase n=1 Tax=Jiangella asiatica TaxID=2530372 RepID=A0A4R5DBY6_9ACTN|nr:sulfatase-like hydrolase/transferase [Jiangella asiatica]TDE11226.1 arylsulfatase [Jiangella asiatica]